jgi:hypothetical protein
LEREDMATFKVFAKISGMIDAATPEEAQKHAERVLSHLLEPKGFDLMGVAPAPQRAAEPAHTDESSESEAFKILRSIDAEIFRGHSIQQFPLTIDVAGFEAMGTVVEIPKEGIREPNDFMPKPPKDHPDDPDPEVPPGEKFDVPEDHTIYAWKAKIDLEPELAGKAANLAGKFAAEMSHRIVSLHGKVHVENHYTDTNPETDEPVVYSVGIFSAPVSPEEMALALGEQLGMHGILPKSVATKTEWDTPLEGLLKSLKS